MVVPISKNGNCELISNYKLITLLLIVPKVFEKILKIILTNFLESNRNFSQNQLDFLKGRSSEMAINKLLSNINKEKVVGLFLDTEKAFYIKWKK